MKNLNYYDSVINLENSGCAAPRAMNFRYSWWIVAKKAIHDGL